LNTFDLSLVIFGVIAVAVGFRIGFVTRVLSWVGMVVGLLVGVRLLPVVFERIEPTSHPRVTLLGIGLVLLCAFLGQAGGFLLGSRLRPVDDDGTVTRSDGLFGALAGVIGLTVAVWLLVPVLLQTPGWLAREVSTSWVARQIDDRLPAPPDAVQAFRSLVGDDNFPEVFANLTPTPDLGPPPAATGLSEARAAEVARSVVRVEGIACRRIQNGTGFVAQDGFVVTNAHVVAGQSSTDLVRHDGTRVEAFVVAFDPDRDLALLSAPGLDRPPLTIGEGSPGAQGGVFGHPGGQPLRIAPFSVARQLTATGRNIYGTALTQREILELASSLRPGDSGSPLVAPDGTVIGITFAIARDRGDVAYALDTSELRVLLDRASADRVDTGPCVAG
jgi:S1-C subfamily serine protease